MRSSPIHPSATPTTPTAQAGAQNSRPLRDTPAATLLPRRPVKSTVRVPGLTTVPSATPPGKIGKGGIGVTATEIRNRPMQERTSTQTLLPRLSSLQQSCPASFKQLERAHSPVTWLRSSSRSPRRLTGL